MHCGLEQIAIISQRTFGNVFTLIIKMVELCLNFHRFNGRNFRKINTITYIWLLIHCTHNCIAIGINRFILCYALFLTLQSFMCFPRRSCTYNTYRTLMFAVYKAVISSRRSMVIVDWLFERISPGHWITSYWFPDVCYMAAGQNLNTIASRAKLMYLGSYGWIYNLA